METRPGNAERGWNDPPEFIHTGSQAPAPGQKRNFLNKRVAYPGITSSAPSIDPACPNVSGPVTGTSPVQPVTMPTNTPESTQGGATSSSTGAGLNPVTLGPAPAGGVILFPPASSTDIPRFTAPIIVPTMSPKDEGPLSSSIVTIATNPVTNARVNTRGCDKEDLDIPDFDSDEQMYHFVVTRLQKTCVDCSSVVKPRVVEDINRKLEVFSKMWKDGKISYPVKSSMARLATALHRRKCDIAHELHLTLMMDYVSEVGQWMVGIKRLIQEARNTEAPLSPTNSAAEPLVSDTNSAQQRLETLALSAKNTPEQTSAQQSAGSSVSQSENSQGDLSTKEPSETDTQTDHNVDSTEHSSVDSEPAIISTSPITG